MILSESEVIERIESPLNLLNRLRSAHVNSHTKTPVVSLPPTSSEIIDDLQEKIQVGSIKSKAMGIMVSAMDELKTRLPEVQKPERLAAIAAEMGKVINSTQIKIEDNRKQAQIIIYAPQVVNEDRFDVIDMRAIEEHVNA
jgi:hypothetical protein